MVPPTATLSPSQPIVGLSKGGGGVKVQGKGGKAPFLNISPARTKHASHNFRPSSTKITPGITQRGLGQTVRRRSITILALYNEPAPFCSRRMKPSSWYSTTVLVVFFYLYVLAVQYIRAAEVLPDQGKVSFQEEAPRRLSPSEQRVLSRPDSPLALTSYGDGGGEESLDGGGESQDSGGESLRSVGVGSASLDRAVDYRPGYNLDPAYNQYYDSSQGTDPSYGLEFKYHDFRTAHQVPQDHLLPVPQSHRSLLHRQVRTSETPKTPSRCDAWIEKPI
uniref:Uncharacterized protein n=1 Tax=Timema monikensis TaxID=170555 RepID=A0A7R9E155_9NEOP|nr:unnamed protein product [Timema monikensis]